MKHLKTYVENIGMTFQEWLVINRHRLQGPISPDRFDTSMSTSHIQYITNINCSKSNLIDLDGIEKFINLKYLNCVNNNLKTLPDLSKLVNLIYLNCSDNQLTELPDLTELENLQSLYCGVNRLPYNDLEGYIEWHKKEYPWIWDSKKYNL